MEKKIATLVLAVLVIESIPLIAGEFFCLKDEGVTVAEVAEFYYSDFATAESNPKLKCFAACILEKFNVLEGCTFLHEEMKQRAMDKQQGLFVRTADACKDSVKASERCECGFEVARCMFEFGKSEKGK